MKQVIILFVVLLSSFFALAQSQKEKRRAARQEKINTIVKQEEQGVVYFKKQTVFGIQLNTDGFGAFLEKGYSKSLKKALLFQVSISEKKHNKEIKVSNVTVPGSPFLYGKVNFVYPLQLGAQIQFLLGNKTPRNGVHVSGNFGGGLSLALLRPYEVQVEKNNELVFIRYNSADSLAFLGPSVRSGPRFVNGWNGLKVNPGIYAKAALRFDYGVYSEIVSAIEVGIKAEVYSSKIQQMAWQKDRQLFTSAYFSILFGHRK